MTQAAVTVATHPQPEPVDAEEQADVWVLGAGIAGLGAARRLSHAGLRVGVLEARDRIGGRIHAHSVNGRSVEVGAAWLHNGPENPVTEFLARHGVGSVPDHAGPVEVYYGPNRLEGTTVRRHRGRIRKALWYHHRRLDRLPPEQDMAAALQARIAVADQEAVHPLIWETYRDYVAAVEGADPEVLSLHHLLTHDAPEDDRLPVGGMSRLVEVAAEGLDIRCNTTVTGVAYDAAGVTVTTDRGRFRAPRVVVTLPLAVLKAGTPTFDPPLPEAKRAAMARHGVGLLNKIVLAYDTPFWPARGAAWALFDQKTPEPYTFSTSGKPEDPLLTVFLGGERARRLEALDDAVIADMMTQRLRACFGETIPAPQALHVTRWGRDPFSLGGYSYLGTHAHGDEMAQLAEPVADRLFFAGEATIAVYYSTVHGAWLSGLREAERLLAATRPDIPPAD